LTELETKRRASELLQRGRLGEAVRQYEELLATQKRPNPAILNLIGDIRIKQGDYGGGFECYLKAAKTYGEEGLFHNAIAVGKKILRLDPEQTNVLAMLGDFYARQGLGMDALKFLKEYARRKEEASEFPAALAAFAELCEILKSFPEAYVEYAAMLEKVDRWDEAATKYEHVAQICEERGLNHIAAQWQARAAAMHKGRGAPEGDLPESLGEMMGLRTLQDNGGGPALSAPEAEDERDSFWGRREEPEGLGELETSTTVPLSGPLPPLPPTPSVLDIPWKVYDPSANPDLPPPPPLPGRGPKVAAAAPPPEPSVGEEPLAEAAPPEPEVAATPPAAEPAVAGPEEGAPEQEEDSVPLEELPGVIMPPHKQEPEPVEAAAEGTSATPPKEDKSQLLDEFFESAGPPAGQAVVIGDDFELVREGGDVAEVISDFRSATAEILELDDFQSHYDLGMTYLEMELFDEAASEFEVSARGETFVLASQEMLGYCFLRRGQIDLAIRELRKGLEIPGHGDRDRLGLLYNLGIACGVTDQEEEAIDCFRRILEIDPDFRDARSRLERLVQNSA
jgi:tetratricopeptide (TPR) repeat protein